MKLIHKPLTMLAHNHAELLLYSVSTCRIIDATAGNNHTSYTHQISFYKGIIWLMTLSKIPLDLEHGASRIRRKDNRGESMTYQQPKLGQYDYYEVISALRKTIKLGQEADALYWLNVLVTLSPSGAKTAAKQLWIMAAEDIDDEMVVLRAFAVYQMAGKVSETDHLFFLTSRMCRAPKWWATADGSCTDYLWSKAIGDLKKHPKPIPSYALDEHTAKGAIAKKAGRHIDNRFSGHDYGRQQTKYMYDRDGFISPDGYPDDQFFTYWEQYRELLGEQDEPQQQPLLVEESL